MGNVGDDSSLVNCVIGADAHVPPHSQLVDAKVPNPETSA
jgi:hypothetical protein